MIKIYLIQVTCNGLKQYFPMIKYYSMYYWPLNPLKSLWWVEEKRMESSNGPRGITLARFEKSWISNIDEVNSLFMISALIIVLTFVYDVQ